MDESGFPWMYVTEIAFLTVLCLLLAYASGAAFARIRNHSGKRLSRILFSLLAGGIAAALSYLLHASGAPDFIVLTAAFAGAATGCFAGLQSGLFMQPGPDSLEFSIAKRMFLGRQRWVSGLLLWLGIISIMLSIATMEISVSVLHGYIREVKNKAVGFGSHIQITDYTDAEEAKFVKIPRHAKFVETLRSREDVQSVSPFVTVPGVVQNGENIEGVLMKGVDKTFDWTFFSEHLREGRLPAMSDTAETREVIVSRKLARLLDLKNGANLMFYFFDEKPRVRKMQICGIYETGLEEFDAANVLCDMRILQRLVGFSEEEVMGFEVNLHSLETLESTAGEIYDIIPSRYLALTITDRYPEIFNWLDVQHQNVWAIIFLMSVIAVINMITVTLITILERTKTIGILKALGMRRGRIMGIFTRNTFLVILAGVVLGNLLGFGLILLQQQTGFIQVNQESYLVRVVPVKWVWEQFLLINAAVVLICNVFTWLPARIITGISPLSALRFE